MRDQVRVNARGLETRRARGREVERTRGREGVRAIDRERERCRKSERSRKRERVETFRVANLYIIDLHVSVRSRWWTDSAKGAVRSFSPPRFFTWQKARDLCFFSFSLAGVSTAV